MLRDGSFMVIAKASEEKVLVAGRRKWGPPDADDARRARGSLGRRADPDGAAGRPFRPHAALSTSPGFLGANRQIQAPASARLLPRLLSSCSSLRWVSPLFFQVVIDKVLVHRFAHHARRG